MEPMGFPQTAVHITFHVIHSCIDALFDENRCPFIFPDAFVLDRIPYLFEPPCSRLVNKMFSCCVWKVCSECIDPLLVKKLRVTYDEFCQMWSMSNQKHARWLQILLDLLGATVS
eukprot:3826776-Karenia_brevis.AAC.1